MEEAYKLKPATAIPSNLIVNYLPTSINSDEALKALFSPFGGVESCKLMINKHTGESKIQRPSVRRFNFSNHRGINGLWICEILRGRLGSSSESHRCPKWYEWIIGIFCCGRCSVCCCLSECHAIRRDREMAISEFAILTYLLLIIIIIIFHVWLCFIFSIAFRMKIYSLLLIIIYHYFHRRRFNAGIQTTESQLRKTFCSCHS